MALVFKRVGDHAGYHALIVGISDYTYLPLPGEPDIPHSLGMRRLASPAISAYRLYKWLIDCDARGLLPKPLSTIRLLIAPSFEEIAMEPELDPIRLNALRVLPGNKAHGDRFADTWPVTDAGREHFAKAAAGWRDSAAYDRDGYTLFSFGGHGVQRSQKDPVFLLQEFGISAQSLLEQGIDAVALVAGMSPHAAGERIAGTQLYLFDMCRDIPWKLLDVDEPKTGHLWDLPRLTPGLEDYRNLPIFYSTPLGGSAEGQRGEFTFFHWALMKCLREGWAGIEEESGVIGSEEPANWIVTTSSLAETMQRALDEVRRVFQCEQAIVSDGINPGTRVVNLDMAPSAELRMEVEKPANGSAIVRVTLLSAKSRLVYQVGPPVDPHPYNFSLAAGIYRIHGDVPATPRKYKSCRGIVQLTAPRRRVSLRLEESSF